jgi:hypothetical protein
MNSVQTLLNHAGHSSKLLHNLLQQPHAAAAYGTVDYSADKPLTPTIKCETMEESGGAGGGGGGGGVGGPPIKKECLESKSLDDVITRIIDNRNSERTATTTFTPTSFTPTSFTPTTFSPTTFTPTTFTPTTFTTTTTLTTEIVKQELDADTQSTRVR